ncbi:hypothetical protein [Phaeobacter sp. C3_T13_0]|uniref:hypothetical protein n=1 Tax=Phaeobacter cretensis TaxID=3342641 RepID=UPI0039BC3972
MKFNIIKVFFLLCTIVSSPASAEEVQDGALLNFSDGRASLSNIGEINKVLLSVGVHLAQIDVPAKSVSLLRTSLERPLKQEEATQILSYFSLSRAEVLEQAGIAGREAVIEGGGSMSTGEAGVASYPKLYDLRSMGTQDRLGARNKFARLHVNSTDDGMGVDEVMTLPSGGPWTWYFQIEDGVTVELHMAKIAPGDKAWRLKYPGLTPHGAYFHSEVGLCIAYITGPETWTMRYEAPGFTKEAGLGGNPFIDFSKP